MQKTSRRSSQLILLAILFLSLGLNLYGNDFSLGFHIDEIGKVSSIQTGSQNFKHPILMLQVVRIARLIVPVKTDAQIVELGRITTAIFGTLLVYLNYQIAKRHLPLSYALATAGLTAVLPGIVIHSHYLKEDIVFAFTILLSFILFFRFADQIISQNLPTFSISRLPWLQIALFGLAIGLLTSTKYNSAIVLFCFVLAPVYVRMLRKSSYFLGLFISLIIGFFTFLLINYPLLLDPEIFITGMSYEFNHALAGHYGLYIEPFSQSFIFHFRESIFPSMTPLPIVLAGMGLLISIYHWRQIAWQVRFLIVFIILYYLVLESSPLKPFPGFIRYVVPILPIAAFLCMRAIAALASMLPDNSKQGVVTILTGITILLPLVSSARLVSVINSDTRSQLELLLKNKQEPIVGEQYARISPGSIQSLAQIDFESDDQPFCTLVASSFMYDRYFFGDSLEDQEPIIYKYSDQYKKLFERPHQVIVPKYRSFAFSNPTLRIFDLCPPLWSASEKIRLRTFLEQLEGDSTGKLRIYSPSPSPIRPIEVNREISLEPDIGYPDLLLLPENEPIYYALEGAQSELPFRPDLFQPVNDGVFTMINGKSLKFIQARRQTESSARHLADNGVDWTNESGWTLLGYDIWQDSKKLEIDTYWRIETLPEGFSERFMTRFYQVFNSKHHKLENVGSSGQWGNSVKAGDVLVEHIIVPISAEWESGSYTLSFGLYDPIHNTNFYFDTPDRPSSFTVDFEIPLPDTRD